MTSNSSKDIRMRNLIPGPKPRKTKVELRLRCENMSEQCLQVLEEIMNNSKERTQDRLTAVELVLAYGYGKPAPWVELPEDAERDKKITEQKDREFDKFFGGDL